MTTGGKDAGARPFAEPGPSFRLTRVPQQQENSETGAGFGYADSPPTGTGAGRGCSPSALGALEFLFDDGGTADDSSRRSAPAIHRQVPCRQASARSNRGSDGRGRNRARSTLAGVVSAVRREPRSGLHAVPSRSRGGKAIRIIGCPPVFETEANGDGDASLAPFT